MEIHRTRPAVSADDVRAERRAESSQRFAARAEEDAGRADPHSDANTRLSRPVDSVDVSDGARELARRDAAEPSESSES